MEVVGHDRDSSEAMGCMPQNASGSMLEEPPSDALQGASGYVRLKGSMGLWWYALVVLLVLLTALLAIQGVLATLGGSGNALFFLLGTVIFVLVDCWAIDTCIRNFVEFHTGFLRIILSFAKEDIEYGDISNVREISSSANPSSAAGKVGIVHGKGEAVVSVKDVGRLLDELAMRNPSIEIIRNS